MIICRHLPLSVKSKEISLLKTKIVNIFINRFVPEAGLEK